MKQKENKYSKIQYFLWLVAGSEISVLKKCPNDYNRHANIGLMIIITSLFAGITAFVAGSTFAENVLINGKVIEQVNTLGVVHFCFVWAFLNIFP
jgi:nicotinamide riboside transporter PnuC